MATAITAKVKLTAKSATSSNLVSLAFGPDYQDERNQEWAHATPYLNLQMNVKSDVAANFEQGKAYTLTFEPNED